MTQYTKFPLSSKPNFDREDTHIVILQYLTSIRKLIKEFPEYKEDNLILQRQRESYLYREFIKEPEINNENADSVIDNFIQNYPEFTPLLFSSLQRMIDIQFSKIIKSRIKREGDILIDRGFYLKNIEYAGQKVGRELRKHRKVLDEEPEVVPVVQTDRYGQGDCIGDSTVSEEEDIIPWDGAVLMPEVRSRAERDGRRQGIRKNIMKKSFDAMAGEPVDITEDAVKRLEATKDPISRYTIEAMRKFYTERLQALIDYYDVYGPDDEFNSMIRDKDIIVMVGKALQRQFDMDITIRALARGEKDRITDDFISSLGDVKHKLLTTDPKPGDIIVKHNDPE